MNPRISIITPSYNQAQFLEATIQSVLMQDYFNVEYIIVDGGSMDGSVEIIQKYADQLAWWVSEADNGQADAINKGIKRAKGEILTWLNSDDIYLSKRVISEVINYFQNYSDANVISGNGVIIDKNGHWTRPININPNHIHSNALKYRNGVLQPATFFRKSSWDKVNLNTSLHYVFDWDLWLQLSHQAHWLVVPQIWAGYRWWEENKTARGDSRRTKEQANIIHQYIGPRSWQYITIRFFAHIFVIAEYLPPKIEVTIKKSIQLISHLLSKASRRKIPVV